MSVTIEPSWHAKLHSEFDKDYFKKLVDFVKGAYRSGGVYPPGSKIFDAFRLCPYDKVKVVILGQDPYHGAGQAHGLCFSVPKNIPMPPSLVNIFKELQRDLGKPMPPHGNLEHWAEQGVLLLNATLTVAAGKAGSHQHQGWETFTDAVIQCIASGKEHVVFLLWGAYAKEKGCMIDRTRHLVLTSSHPSPFSFDRGFYGNAHFSQTNAYLVAKEQAPIDW